MLIGVISGLMTSQIIKASPLPKLDILFVIDTSGSMSEEQYNLSAKVHYLFHYLKKVDWRANIITADSHCPISQDLPVDLTKYSSDQATTILARELQAGTAGDSSEQPLKNIVYNLQNKITTDSRCQNPGGWLRKDAKLAVIVVGDEDDQTSLWGKDVTSGFLSSVSSAGYLPKKNLKVFGIVNNQARGCGRDVATNILDVVSATKGSWGCISLTDYSTTLLRFSYALKKFIDMH